MADDADTKKAAKPAADAAPTRPEAGTIVWGDDQTVFGRSISVTKYDVDGATTFQNVVRPSETADQVRARLAGRAGVPVPDADQPA